MPRSPRSHWPPATGQSTALNYSNNLAPVDVCAYNLCPGVGKRLLKTVLSNSDITQPTWERMTRIDGSTPIIPSTSHINSLWKDGWGVTTRSIITSSHFKKPCIESRATNLRNSPWGKKETLSSAAWIFQAVWKELWNQTDLSSNISLLIVGLLLKCLIALMLLFSRFVKWGWWYPLHGVIIHIERNGTTRVTWPPVNSQ